MERKHLDCPGFFVEMIENQIRRLLLECHSSVRWINYVLDLSMHFHLVF